MSLRNIPEDNQKYLYNIDGKFVPLSQNLTLINYQKAHIIRIGIREGKEVIKQEIDIDTEIETEEGKAEILLPSDIFKAQNTKELSKTNN
jgi:hypothetical protein